MPEGFDTIDLPAAKYLMFKGKPLAEEDYREAIEEVQAAIESYAPSIIHSPSGIRGILLAPIGTRGYTELLPVK